VTALRSLVRIGGRLDTHLWCHISRKRRRQRRLLARPQAQSRPASSPYLHGGHIAGAASGTFFRRNEGAFLSSHYLAAEIAPPAVEHGTRLCLIRLICLWAARYGVQLSHLRFISVGWCLSPLTGVEVSQFSPPLWPWLAERAAGPPTKRLPQGPLIPGASQQFLHPYFETSWCSLT
jgi:hypothetical protein